MLRGLRRGQESTLTCWKNLRYRNAISEIHRGLRRFFGLTAQLIHSRAIIGYGKFPPTLSFLILILCGPLSHLPYQRNPRSKLSVAAEPPVTTGRQASCLSRPMGILPVDPARLEADLPRQPGRLSCKNKNVGCRCVFRKVDR